MNAYYDVNIKKWRLSEIERVDGAVSDNGSRWVSALCIHTLTKDFSQPEITQIGIAAYDIDSGEVIWISIFKSMADRINDGYQKCF